MGHFFFFFGFCLVRMLNFYLHVYLFYLYWLTDEKVNPRLVLLTCWSWSNIIKKINELTIFVFISFYRTIYENSLTWKKYILCGGILLALLLWGRAAWMRPNFSLWCHGQFFFSLVLFTHIFTVKLLNDPLSWGLAHCSPPQAEVDLLKSCLAGWPCSAAQE